LAASSARKGREVLDLRIPFQVGALEQAMLEPAERVESGDDVRRRWRAIDLLTGAFGERGGADE
jgi:hypothetical protein